MTVETWYLTPHHQALHREVMERLRRRARPAFAPAEPRPVQSVEQLDLFTS